MLDFLHRRRMAPVSPASRAIDAEPALGAGASGTNVSMRLHCATPATRRAKRAASTEATRSVESHRQPIACDDYSRRFGALDASTPVPLAQPVSCVTLANWCLAQWAGRLTLPGHSGNSAGLRTAIVRASQSS